MKKYSRSEHRHYGIGSKHFAILAVFLMAVSGFAFLVVSKSDVADVPQMEKFARASDFFDGHNYYTDLHVIGTPSGDQANYQVRLIVYSGAGTNLPNATYLNSHALNWPYDIRFTKADSATQLDFWRESYDANNMTVWIELDSILAYPASTDFFIHYGKAAEADASNGNNTFAFFDDFLGVALEAHWAVSQTVTVSAGQAHFTVGTDTVTTESYVMSSDTFGPNIALESSFYVTTKARLGFTTARTTFGTGAWDMIGTQFYYSTWNYHYMNTNDGSATPLQTSTSIYTRSWQITSINWTVDRAVYLLNRTSVWGTQVSQIPHGTNLNLYLRDIMDIDWVFVRNHQLVSPTWGVVGTENSAIPLITSVMPITGYTGYVFSYHAACMYLGASGTVNWQLYSNATWLTLGTNGTGFQNIGGTPTVVGSFYANLSVNDSDSSDYENSTITVNDGGAWSTWNGFLDSLNFTRSSLNPLMIPTEAWEGQNIGDFSIVEEATELRMYYSGFATAIKNGIGLATSPLTYPPTSWTKQSMVFTGNATAGQWDTGWVRLGNVLKVAGTYYMYYEGSPSINEGGTDKIGLATSPDGITWTRNVSWSNPILVPSGDENQVEDPTVIRVDATHWYMYYCYRTPTSTLPAIRVATSPDGFTWTKAGNVTTKGLPGEWDDTYMEHAQIHYIGGRYVLTYESVGGLVGEPWEIGIAYSDSPTGTFTKYAFNPIFGPSGVSGAFDQYHVATPSLFYHDNVWYLFFQGGNVSVPYGNSFWRMGIASSSEPAIVPPPIQPSIPSSIQASFIFSIDGLKVAFADTTHNGSTFRVWNFGDGWGSTNPAPTHKYKNSGTYRIEMTAYDEDEHSSVAQTNIEVSIGPSTPLEKTETGWRVYIDANKTVAVSAVGLGATGAIMIVSSYLFPNFPIMSARGRRLIGAIMLALAFYALVFVRGVVDIGGFG